MRAEPSLKNVTRNNITDGGSSTYVIQTLITRVALHNLLITLN